jgi:hypothetical protein
MAMAPFVHARRALAFAYTLFMWRQEPARGIGRRRGGKLQDPAAAET